jgi:cytochrome P450
MPSGQARQSDLAKTAFSAFGAGARICLGVHLAYMEIRLATALFLKRYPTAEIAPTMKPADMEVESFFLITPIGHKMDVVLK